VIFLILEQPDLIFLENELDLHPNELPNKIQKDLGQGSLERGCHPHPPVFHHFPFKGNQRIPLPFLLCSFFVIGPFFVKPLSGRLKK